MSDRTDIVDVTDEQLSKLAEILSNPKNLADDNPHVENMTLIKQHGVDVEHRTVFMGDIEDTDEGSQVTWITSEMLIRNLLYLDNISDQPITLYIHSPGGSVSSAFKIVDTIRHLRSPVHAIVAGNASSAASLITFVCDHRAIYENAFIMIHEGSISYSGSQSSIESEVRHNRRMDKRWNELVEQYTYVTVEMQERWGHLDLEFTAEEALELGMVDEIIRPKKVPVKEKLTKAREKRIAAIIKDRTRHI